MQNPILLYIITSILTLALSLFLIRHYKLSKYQIMIFILLLVFWSSVNLIRAYRKSYAANPISLGGLELGLLAASNIAAAYGLISIFMRFLVFLGSDWLKSRKSMIFFGLVLISLTSFWVYLDPNYSSLLYSSYALGIGASLLSLFNVLFAETFSPKQAMMSVSILSVAPLLAEFVMSPIQYHFTKSGVANYGVMWLISSILALASIFLLLWVTDNKQESGTMKLSVFKEIITKQSTWFFGGLGIVVSLIRFALSGSNIITYVQNDFIAMDPFSIAYIDFIYSIAQLIAGVLAGLYFARKFTTKWTLVLGLSFSLMFNLILLFTYNPNLIFWSYLLSGFGYGLTYNSLIGLTLENVAVNRREMNMAIFQTFFAIGIFFGDKIYAAFVSWLPPQTTTISYYYQVFLWMAIATAGLIAFTAIFVKRKDETARA